MGRNAKAVLLNRSPDHAATSAVKQPKCDMTYFWGNVLISLLVALLAARALCGAAVELELRPLEGMDDEVHLARAQQLQKFPMADLARELLRMPDVRFGLGVWEPCAVAFRVALLKAFPFQGSLHHFALAGLGLHCINVGLAFLVSEALCAQAIAWITEAGNRQRSGSGRKGSQSDANGYSFLRWGCAGFAALYFGTHPMRVEVVCWFSCQSYALSSFFCLLAIWLRIRCRRPYVEFVLFTLAVFSKTAAVPLPLVLELMMVGTGEVFPIEQRYSAKGLRNWTLAVVKRNSLLIIIAAAVVAAAAAAAGPVPADVRPLTWEESWMRASYACMIYVLRTIVPWPWTSPRLAVPDRVTLLTDPVFQLSGIVQAIISSMALFRLTVFLYSLSSDTMERLTQTSRLSVILASAWAAYICFLLPSLGLASGGHVWALAADRYSYLPSMCVLTPLMTCLLHISLGCVLPREGSMAHAACATIVSTACSIIELLTRRSREIALYWIRGGVNLFEAILRVDPNEFSSLKDLGTLYVKHGRHRMAEAVLSQAVQLRPTHAGALLNLATVIHGSGGRSQEAEPKYLSARSATLHNVRASGCGFLLEQPVATVHNPGCVGPATELAKVDANLAGLLLQLGRPHDAVSMLEEAAPWPVAASSARGAALLHYGLSLRQMGRKAKAARILRSASVANPRLASRYLDEQELIVDAVR